MLARQSIFTLNLPLSILSGLCRVATRIVALAGRNRGGEAQKSRAPASIISSKKRRHGAWIVCAAISLATPAIAGLDDGRPPVSAKEVLDRIDEWRQGAKAGDAYAEYVMGYANENGIGTLLDLREAVRWFQLAADQKEAGAAFELGMIYSQGEGLPKDNAEATKYLQQSSDEGYAPAENNLGIRYLTGNGVERDPTKAADLLKRSADQGDAFGQYSLGVLYSARRGNPNDDAEALRLFKAAAAQGNVPAELRLGNIALTGKGGDVDYKEALHQFELAANQRSHSAEIDLGEMYFRGLGTPKDLGAAAKWFSLATTAGSPEAAMMLAWMNEHGMGVPANPTEAVQLYEVAANQGSMDAEVRLGDMFRAGLGVPQSAETASGWYRRAGDFGSTDGRRHLIQMLAIGEAVPISKDELSNLRSLNAAVLGARLSNFLLLHEVAAVLINQYQWSAPQGDVTFADDISLVMLLDTAAFLSSNISPIEILHALARSVPAKPQHSQSANLSAASNDGHALDRPRVLHLVCLMAGARPELFSPDADDLGIADIDRSACADQYAAMHISIAKLLSPAFAHLGDRPEEAQIILDNPPKRSRNSAGYLTQWGLPDDFARSLPYEYTLGHPVQFHVKSCKQPDVSYDPKAEEITFCYQVVDSVLQYFAATN